MKLVVVVALLFSMAARADDLEAQAQEAAASSYLQAGLLPDALEAITRAIAAAPERAAAYATRAEIRLAMAGPASELPALATPRVGTDYAAIATVLAGARDDLQQYLRLSLAAEDRDARIRQLGGVLARLGAAEKAKGLAQTMGQEDELLRQAQDIESEERAAAEEARQRRMLEAGRQERLAVETKAADDAWLERKSVHDQQRALVVETKSVNSIFMWSGLAGVAVGVPITALGLYLLGQGAGPNDVGPVLGMGAAGLLTGTIFAGVGFFGSLGEDPGEFAEPRPANIGGPAR